MRGLALEIRNAGKSYGAVEVLRRFDLQVLDGEFIVLVGPSGCGKSTLLRMIAGLEDISAGEILIGGRVVNELAPGRRGIAMVFQNYALYPHMTVRQNMGFALRNDGMPKAEIARRVKAAAETLEIVGLLDRKPGQLSGGQRQRVAIGRAIVREPKVFLFDEPLSNLDAALRVQTRVEIAKLHSKLRNTILYVTHDQVEAMTLADRIVVLNQGRPEQVGTPEDLYERPATRFVAGFIGTPAMNMIEGRAERGRFVSSGGVDLALPASLAGIEGPATLGIRPEHLWVQDDGQLTGVVQVSEYLGERSHVHAHLPDGTAVVAMAEGEIKAGAVRMTVAPDRIHLFGPDGRSAASRETQA